MLEIRGGAGGDKLNIFAGDLMRMYLRYADKMGWQTQILSKTDYEACGVSEVIISMKGDSIFSRLKYESGVHRVQRVPAKQNPRAGFAHLQQPLLLCLKLMMLKLA